MAGTIFKDEYASSLWCTTRASRHSAGGACWHLGDYKKNVFQKRVGKQAEKKDKAKER